MEFNISLFDQDDILLADRAANSVGELSPDAPDDLRLVTTFVAAQRDRAWNWGSQLNFQLSDSWEIHTGVILASENWEGIYQEEVVNTNVFFEFIKPLERITFYHLEFPLGFRYRINQDFDLGLQNRVRIFASNQDWPNFDEFGERHFDRSLFNPGFELGYRAMIGKKMFVRGALQLQQVRQAMRDAPSYNYGVYGVSLALHL